MTILDSWALRWSIPAAALHDLRFALQAAEAEAARWRTGEIAALSRCAELADKLAAAEGDARRLDWVLARISVDRHGISLPCGRSGAAPASESRTAIDAAILGDSHAE